MVDKQVPYPFMEDDVVKLAVNLVLEVLKIMLIHLQVVNFEVIAQVIEQ